MNPSPRQAGPSLHRDERNEDDTFAERHYTSTPTGDAHQVQYFDAAIGGRPDAEALQPYQEHTLQRYGNANDFGQYHAFDSGFEADRYASQDPRAFESFPPCHPWNDHGILRGASNYRASAGPGMQNLDAGSVHSFLPQETHSPFMMPRRSVSVASGSPAPAHMQSPQERLLLEYTTSTGEQDTARQTKYAAFQGRFPTPEHARDHRRLATRFDREPYIPPDTDGSIAEIEAHRQRHVERIYNAMTSGERAKDNSGSIAMKRWVLDSHYPPDLVEAYAHKVFDCLLQQAKEGFRGWIHNDYVADERKGEIHDKEVNCAQRLDNIISALQQEKTICEDVMNSACQIRMFVNAPTAYANRKHQNRVGNSKRGRTKDAPDANPKPAKRRTVGRSVRARSGTASDRPGSRGATQQEQQLVPHSTQHAASPTPYFGIPHNIASPIMSSYGAPRSTPHQRAVMPASWTKNAMSPPAPAPHSPQTHMLRMHTAPLLRHSPPTSHGHFSASTTPDEAKPVDLANIWHTDNMFGDAQGKGAIDPTLTLPQWGLPEMQALEHREQRPSFFGQHEDPGVSPADVGYRHGMTLDDSLCHSWNDVLQRMPQGGEKEGRP